ncbi:type II secretion system F family protein, partial [Bacillus sp. S34]|nr:type II secretion system F family protein [Bacillus sp. S34]
VLIMSLLSVVIMLVFIVPIFQKMFEGLGGKLPLPTQMVVYLSHAMIYVGPVLAVAIVAYTLWWRAKKNTDAVRSFLDTIKLRLP